MKPELNRESSTPIFQQIMNWMREKIQSGEWDDDQKLLSETDLAERFNVSRGTIRKAIEGLIEEKRLVRIHGKGTYVRDEVLLEQEPSWRLAGFSLDLISRGIPYTTEVLLKEVINPPVDVREILKLDPGEKIFHMQRLRKINEIPVLLIENHILYAPCEGVERIDFTSKQLYETLEDQFGIQFDWARRTYKADSAGQHISEVLELQAHDPVMYVEEIYHDVLGKPVEYTRAWFNAQVFLIRTIIRREDEKSAFPGLFHQNF